jgi:hypothetical protein
LRLLKTMNGAWSGKAEVLWRGQRQTARYEDVYALAFLPFSPYTGEGPRLGLEGGTSHMTGPASASAILLDKRAWRGPHPELDALIDRNNDCHLYILVDR